VKILKEAGIWGRFFLKFVNIKRESKVDITPFIRELLFGHDCVIVPGFGGFIGNYTQARIDKATDTFFPPARQISFNRNLTHNDGLLIGKISESLHVNYRDARELTGEYADNVRRKIERGDKVVFDKIGVFFHDHEGNLQFEPDRNANYYLGSYGLDSFHCIPAEGYDVRKRIMKTSSFNNTSHTSLKKILWRAAVIIPLLSVLVAVPLKTDLFRTKVDSLTMNPLVIEEFENNRKALNETGKNEIPVITVEAPKARTEVPAEGVVAEPAKPVNAKPVNPENHNFYLITGSFKSEVNALLQVNMLKEEGFQPEIVTMPNGFFRVCAMTCSDVNTALYKKDSIAKRFPGTWVSEKK
jgi:hypothetical protein